MKYRSGRMFVCAALLSVMVASPCFAQREGRRGGGEGRRGPGGAGMFGGRMAGGTDVMLLGLLRVEEVQQELDLRPEQIEAIENVSQRGERPDFDRNASEADRREAMRARMEEINKRAAEQLEEVLLPDQLERGREIVLQQQGAAALSDPEVAAKLDLTEEQKEKIAERQRAAREKMIASMREAFGSGDREAIAKSMAEARESTLQEVLAVLTPEQREKYESMRGEKFDLPASAMMRGFGGGRPGGGRPGAGQGRGGRGGRGGN